MTAAKMQRIIDSVLAEDEKDQVLLADGLESAFVGIGRQFGHPVAVYSRRKAIEALRKSSSPPMNHEDAEEFFSFNVEGAYVGKATPVFLEEA